MKKICAILSLLILTGCTTNQIITINDENFIIEQATTPEEITTGLMYRSTMLEKHGMLFVFDQAKPRSFWMKNTYIPLDIIFINADKQVINIASNVLPCKDTDIEQLQCPTYESSSPAQYVLEFNAGESQKYNIERSQQLSF